MVSYMEDGPGDDSSHHQLLQILQQCADHWAMQPPQVSALMKHIHGNKSSYWLLVYIEVKEEVNNIFILTRAPIGYLFMLRSKKRSITYSW